MTAAHGELEVPKDVRIDFAPVMNTDATNTDDSVRGSLGYVSRQFRDRKGKGFAS